MALSKSRVVYVSLGIFMVAVSVVAFIFGMSGFTSSEPLTPVMDQLSQIAFFTFWIPAVIAAVFFWLGGYRVPPNI